MRVHTRTVWEIQDDGGLHLILDEGYEYVGDVSLAKKGREEAKQATASSLEETALKKAKQAENYPIIRNYGTSLLQGATGTSPFSSNVAGQYAGDVEKIIANAKNLKQAAEVAGIQRGFGGAPSGFAQVGQNAIIQQSEADKANAYRTALQRQFEEGQVGAGVLQNLYGQADPNAQIQTSLQGAQTMHNVGNTASDILSGVSGLGGVAASLLNPASGFAKLAKYAPTGSGVGSLNRSSSGGQQPG